jgi:hypothetical protein
MGTGAPPAVLPSRPEYSWAPVRRREYSRVGLSTGGAPVRCPCNPIDAEMPMGKARRDGIGAADRGEPVVGYRAPGYSGSVRYNRRTRKALLSGSRSTGPIAYSSGIGSGAVGTPCRSGALAPSHTRGIAGAALGAGDPAYDVRAASVDGFVADHRVRKQNTARRTVGLQAAVLAVCSEASEDLASNWV